MLLHILSYVSLMIQLVFITLSIATCLYYLAELVEEYTVLTKYVISWLIYGTTAIHIMLIIWEDLPILLNGLGLIQQLLHGLMLLNFPVVKVISVPFLTAVVTLIYHHYLAFQFFGNNYGYYSFHEVLAYFTLCLWVVPFALFVSLSANDNVLPTTGERQPLLGDNNVVTDYLSRKSRRYNLLSFFTMAKESILPQQSKKAF